LSIAAILLSVLSAGVNLFVFLAAGQRKTTNEADELQLKASANRVLQEVTNDPKSHPQLSAELTNLYKTLVYRPAYDANLTVYERAAFGLLVEGYARPIAEVQLQTAETRMQLLSHAFGTEKHFFTWAEVACVTDPFGYNCPPVQGVNEKDAANVKK
jgi:hypothetical protein